VVEGEQPAQIDDAEHYLIQAGAGIYQRGEQGLVRIAAYAGAPNANGVKRPGGVPVIAAVSNDWLVDRMTRDIDWVRWDSRTKELVRRNAPMRVAAGMMARAGEWKFPYLTGFCAAPLLDLDGRLISGPGYDEPTGLYLVDPPTIGAPSTTNLRLAQTSVDRVREMLGIGEGLQPERFPFAGPSDVSAALAMVLTALLRPILPTAPICAESAATPGTCKSLWVDLVSMVATVRAATVVNLGKDEEETEKRIASQLILGEPFSFDNIEGAFRSSALCTAATQESMNVRILSQSRMARVLTRVVIYLTGNNVTPLGDLARRVLLTRLDAGCERPELREFKTDALLRAADNRGKVIGHALRISKAYLDAGCPVVPGAAPYGSFRDWDRMVRFPLMWAGLADPLGRAEDIREGDHSLAGMGLLMQAWQKVRPLPCTAAELYDLIVERSPNFDGHRDGPAHPELHDAAVQVRGDPRKWTARDLGYLLREAQGRPINGLRVVNGGKSKRGVLWEVQPL
jgi:putative DNA primase/helicase